jgi:hypothetical protein
MFYMCVYVILCLFNVVKNQHDLYFIRHAIMPHTYSSQNTQHLMKRIIDLSILFMLIDCGF